MQGTVELGGIVGAPRPLIFGNLRIGTEGAGPVDLAIRQTGRDNALGCFSLFHPLFDRANRIERSRPLTEPAMIHSRNHEESVGTLYLIRTSKELQHAVVIVDAIEWRNSRIAPAVIVEQFSAALEETSQIRIYGIGHAAVKPIHPRHLGIEVEGHVIPVRVLKQCVFEILTSAHKRLGEHPANPVRYTPAQFASHCVAGEDLLLSARINDGTVELQNKLDLGWSQAGGIVLAFALKPFWIEIAEPRIL
jgi:hypothetical protein